MIPILTPEEMSIADRCAIENIGISSLVLMENAARALAWFVLDFDPKRVLVVGSTGNNGADALCCARWLFQKGIDVDILITKSQKQSQEFKTQLSILKNLGLKPFYDFPTKEYDVVIDGLFGTGFKPPLKEEYIPYIDFINNSKATVISVDMPSGVPSEYCVKAHYTVSFAYPKTYHILYPYTKYAGTVYVKDISIPKACLPNTHRFLLSIKDIKALIPKREPDTHKVKEGKVLLIGGNAQYLGAIVMSAKACTTAGAGLVYAGIPKEHFQSASNHLIEQIKIGFPSKNYFIERLEDVDLNAFDSIGIGMGFGVYENGFEILKYIIKNYQKSILLDADALNIIAHHKAYELLEKENVVITPHIGEFSRLSGLDKDQITKNQIDLSYEFHKKYKCSVVLKGAISTIATENKVYVSTRGTPAMAKGGVGDVLSGILSAFLSKMSIPKALKLGVFLHGIAGEITTSKSHVEAFSTIDMIKHVSEAFRYIENAKDDEVSYRLHIENMQDV